MCSKSKQKECAENAIINLEFGKASRDFKVLKLKPNSPGKEDKNDEDKISAMDTAFYVTCALILFAILATNLLYLFLQGVKPGDSRFKFQNLTLYNTKWSRTLFMAFGLLLSHAPVASDVTVSTTQGTYFRNDAPGRYLQGYVNESSVVYDLIICQMRCNRLHSICKSLNYIENEDGSHICEINHEAEYCALPGKFIVRENSFYVETLPETVDAGLCSACGHRGVIKKTKEKPGFKCLCQEGFHGDSCQKVVSCDQLNNGPQSIPGKTVYCDMSSGWTLVATFSNSDSKNWMPSSGKWWYDKVLSSGATTNPSSNADMISEAFWKVYGHEIKITRSDDSSHTALLQTTSNCLQGKTFREKITSYGDFRNGAVWANDKCLGSCRVSYSGNYKTTAGFQKHSCNDNIQSSNYIGFWCDCDDSDGAVMMIGGGGKSCERADHGIGITEANGAKFGGRDRYYCDFGHRAEFTPSSSYSLNLWVR